jgi:hypothetical protein
MRANPGGHRNWISGICMRGSTALGLAVLAVLAIVENIVATTF